MGVEDWILRNYQRIDLSLKTRFVFFFSLFIFLLETQISISSQGILGRCFIFCFVLFWFDLFFLLFFFCFFFVCFVLFCFYSRFPYLFVNTLRSCANICISPSLQDCELKRKGTSCSSDTTNQLMFSFSFFFLLSARLQFPVMLRN